MGAVLSEEYGGMWVEWWARWERNAIVLFGRRIVRLGAMTTVGLLEEADLSTLLAAFPEPRSPEHRHTQRFRWQSSGGMLRI